MLTSTTSSPPPASLAVRVRRLATWPPYLYALVFYVVLTLLFAWPVITNLSTGTAGHFSVDRNQNLWDFWWFKRSVFDLTNPYQTDFPMPYRLLSKLPFLDIGRFPERYMLMAQLSIGSLAAFGLTHLLNRFSKEQRVFSRFPVQPLVAGLVLGLVFFESWPGILPPPDPITPPPFTIALAANKPGSTVPPDKGILELPITTHGNPDSPRMLYQTYHQRPITGGYISRKLIDPHRQANDFPLFDWIELRSPEPDIIPTKTPQEQLGLLSYANFGYLVLYSEDPDQPGKAYDATKAERLINYTFTGSVSTTASSPKAN